MGELTNRSTSGDTVTMKAFIYTQYGPPDVLQFTDIPKPTPTDDEVLIEVYAASVNPWDLHLMQGKPFIVRLMAGGLVKTKTSDPGF